MASLKYLIKNRAKFPTGSKSFIIAWVKRLMLLKLLVKRNRQRTKLTRGGAIISDTAEIGLVNAHGLKKRLSVGSFSYIGNNVELALHDTIHIGERVCINDNVHILTASHDVQDPLWQHVKAGIRVDDYAWICTGSIILPGVHIGRGAVVAAGAVVSKNVLAGDIVAGNPARVINKKRAEALSYNPCEFLAPNRAWLIG
jgi:acetyltransferase-like isoleucine patch superfamily enzyme